MNDTIGSILDRRSNRGFEAQPLYPGQLELLEQVAKASPTARNAQSWHFSFVTNTEVIGAVEQATFDELMAKAGEDDKARIKQRGTVFYGAPLVVFISADRNNDWGQIDAGIAVENLAVAAQSLELGSVIIGLCRAAFEGEKKAELAKLLGFPETHDFAIAISIGKPTVTKDAHTVTDDHVSHID